MSLLCINYDVKSGKFATLEQSSRNYRFENLVRFNIKPISYRAFNKRTKKWTVHLSKLHLVVSFGKSCFDRVDYSSLPESVQIFIVTELEKYSKGKAKITINSGIEHYARLYLLPDAPDEVIKASYKALAIKYHPDKGGDEEKFRKIQEAFESLRIDRN